MDVRNDPAAVFESRRDLCCHAIETESLGSGKLDRFVERLAKRELGKRRRDIAPCHRLDQSGGYRDLPLRAFLDDRADELEELGRTENCEWKTGGTDELLLSLLRLEIILLLQPIDADDREHDVMPYACFASGGLQITARGFEEVKRGSTIERRGVRNVDHDVGPIQGFLKSDSSHGIDPDRRRRHDRLNAHPLQLPDQLLADAAGATDHNNSHQASAPITRLASASAPARTGLAAGYESVERS